jgi:hypothetical protein
MRLGPEDMPVASILAYLSGGGMSIDEMLK